MRTLVIYESQVGSTKQYAEDIAKAVGADILPLKKFKGKMIKDSDVLVFGGWVRGAQIMGLNDFLAHYDLMEGKDIIVFSSGMSLATPEGRKSLISSNILDLYHVRYYQFQGSFDYSKLGLKNKFLFNTAIRQVESDPNATAEMKMVSYVKDHPINFYDSEKVNRVISVINKISLERAA
ncbi:MAG: hypothetical protein J6328_05575 [Bacilli bacterium]|nr:hypothetical protein [Bacilli bacterium]